MLFLLEQTLNVELQVFRRHTPGLTKVHTINEQFLLLLKHQALGLTVGTLNHCFATPGTSLETQSSRCTQPKID